MKKYISLTLVLLLSVMFCSYAFAEVIEVKESPRNWTAHISFGVFNLPKLGSEFSSAQNNPVDEIFGKKYRLTFDIGVERILWQEFGTIGLEAVGGFGRASGSGLYESGEVAQDSTALNLIPLRLSVVYRFSAAWDKWKVPLVPFVKLGLDYYVWWISGVDGTSSFEKPDGSSQKGYGGTFGFHVAYGLQICLDFMDPTLATQFDQDAGVNNTYLFFEGIYAPVNDFWSGSSFDFTDHYLMGGLLFEF